MNSEGSGFKLPPGVTLLSEKQLKQISKDLAKKNAGKTQQQVDDTIATATGIRPRPAQPKVPQPS